MPIVASTPSEQPLDRLLIRADMVICEPLSAEQTVLAPGWVAVEKGVVVNLGRGEIPPDESSAANRCVIQENSILCPGFTNAHTHLEQSTLGLVRADGGLFEWLDRVKLLERELTPADVYEATRRGLAENLESGITTVVQHQKIVHSDEFLSATCQAAVDAGVRLIVARGWRDLGPRAENVSLAVRSVDRLRRTWMTHDRDLVTITLGPMVPRRCTGQGLAECMEAVRGWDSFAHMHAAEGAQEEAVLRQREGLGTVSWLESIGVLGPRVQLVHVTAINDDDLSRIAIHGTSVATCPSSNRHLQVGSTNVRNMLLRSIRVGIGTDGSASAGTQRIREPLLVAHDLPVALSSAEAVRLLFSPLPGEYPPRIARGERANLVLWSRMHTEHDAVAREPLQAVFDMAIKGSPALIVAHGRVLGMKPPTLEPNSSTTVCREHQQ